MKTKRTLFDHPDVIDDGAAFLMAAIILLPLGCAVLFFLIHLFHLSE